MGKKLPQQIKVWQCTSITIAGLAGLIFLTAVTQSFWSLSWMISGLGIWAALASFTAFICYKQQYILRQEKAELESLLKKTIEQFKAEKIELEQVIALTHERLGKIQAQNRVLQEMNHRKDEFLRQTSHELRTPMNGIIGSLQLLLDDLCDDHEEEVELLQQAYQSSIHLLTLLNQVLDLAKIESGRLTFDIKSVDLHSSLSAAIYLQLANIRQKNLQLHRKNYLNIIRVKADSTKLKQVFINVIGNAIKFTEEGSITITTEIQYITVSSNNQQPQEMMMAVVTVKDTGVGIDPSNQNQLFQPFQVEDEGRFFPQGSTGLGLVISKHLVEMMGGKIKLSSTGRNQGTTVEIILPLADYDEEVENELNIELNII
ncbi:ATP-binding protein [Limnoraphis robusta Tam1]|uniref:sensor histidine kinase n=1 Tax=Limnoraphis robusta TaxID=1118279 RepID=UPI002B21B72D|nr:ATP-binding protein [Limnoraphis robusta]MEA5498132.1 ATP-binding protein [Limnoraphis robusta BA-68 BA1]MEA5538199.1 ATP-binding protein [Limnoraphis robusta Tam1]